MKIGIAAPILVQSLIEYLPPMNGDRAALGMGAPVINSLIEGFMKKGFKISIYTLDESLIEPIIIESQYLKIYMGKYGKSPKIRAITCFNRESNRIKEFIMDDQPDIVNAHWSYEYADGAIKSGLPHLITIRDHSKTILDLQKDYYRFSKYLLDLKVRRKGKNFNVNSVYLKDKYSTWKKGLPVIPNCFNERYIVKKKKTLPKDRVKIISILTGWGKRKNAKKALEAFSMIKERYRGEIEYHLYGPGYGPGGTGHEWSLKNDFSEGVVFKGPIEHDELMRLVPQYDLLFHPAIEESFGNTLLEGMASGLPVIGGKTAGAVPMVLNYGGNGVLTDVNSPASIADDTLNLLSDKELYERLSLDGLQYVRRKYSPNVIAGEYIRVYEKIINEG